MTAHPDARPTIALTKIHGISPMSENIPPQRESRMSRVIGPEHHAHYTAAMRNANGRKGDYGLLAHEVQGQDMKLEGVGHTNPLVYPAVQNV